MCLRSDKGVPNITKKPMACYKVLRLVDSERYETAFQNCVIEKDVLEGQVEMVAEGRVDVAELENYFPGNIIITDGYKIGGGFIHCYTSESLARCVARNMANKTDETKFSIHYVVFLCEIPEGVEYFVSRDPYHSEVCAKRIKFVGSRYIY